MAGVSGRLDALGTSEIDLLVVGGGIVGSGIVRDAAMRGLKAVLVDQRDFAFGTSSRSSRLLHGGLRYLAQGRVGLVREASHEKMTLSRIAPHLSSALPFVFPTYAGTEWKRWKLSIGVKLYDWLCGASNLGKSQSLSARDVVARVPGLNTDRLTGAVRYYDGLTNDARLVLDTLRSATDAGATVLNYVSYVSGDFGDGVWQCRLRDELAGTEQAVRAKVVVNAAGAWAEAFPQSRVKLRLTKGVHVVVDRSRLPVPDAVVMTEGSRILFAIPWGERTILGTTDTDYAGPTENPDCDDIDVAYVLKIANATFPDSRLSTDDVISAWSGLRPLIADPNGKPSDISRAHVISTSAQGWIDVAGGKLTTYRLMAEQTVDAAERYMGRKTQCRTAHQPLLRAGETAYSGVVPPAVSREAVEHYCTREWARHLDDVMIRRGGWHYYDRDRLAIADRVADWMAESLGWSAERTAAERERYARIAAPLAPLWEPLRPEPAVT